MIRPVFWPTLAAIAATWVDDQVDRTTSIGYGTFWTNLNLIASWVLNRALGIK
jgi:hypothetical protein